LYLSKALLILEENEATLSLSDFDYMMLASNLIDLGRTSESVRFYRKSMEIAARSNNAVGHAAARRVYGRALIASGQHEEGREEMLAAVQAYERLSEQGEYDRDRMRDQAAETFRRLIWVELQANQISTASNDLAALEELVAKVREPTKRRPLESGLEELRRTVSALMPTTETASESSAMGPVAR
jgi:tetratricopeptide (TPR) repeat protein